MCLLCTVLNNYLIHCLLLSPSDKGRVKKIVFSTSNDSVNAELNGVTHDAIVAQEWEVCIISGCGL